MGVIRTVSLYAGCGGLDWGFWHNDLFEHVFVNDFDRNATETYLQNFPKSEEVLHCAPIESILNGICSLRFDLLLAGFPCPAWSLAGKRKGFRDPRGQEFFNCAEVLRWTQPTLFVFENVKGLLSHDGGRSFEFMRQFVNNIGYKTAWSLVNMSDYGAPTNRERVIIVGVHESSTIDPATLIPKKSGAAPIKLGDVLLNLPADCQNQNVHAPPKKSHWIPLLRQGENLRKLTTDEVRRREAERGVESLPIPTSFQDYRRLSIDEIAPTMAFGNTSLPIHPVENRNISVREAAAIQGFPHDFVFKGGISSQYKQVGNAVPPPFSKALADNIAIVWNQFNAKAEANHA